MKLESLLCLCLTLSGRAESVMCRCQAWKTAVELLEIATVAIVTHTHIHCCLSFRHGRATASQSAQVCVCFFWRSSGFQTRDSIGEPQALWSLSLGSPSLLQHSHVFLGTVLPWSSLSGLMPCSLSQDWEQTRIYRCMRTICQRTKDKHVSVERLLGQIHSWCLSVSSAPWRRNLNV